MFITVIIVCIVEHIFRLLLIIIIISQIFLKIENRIKIQ